MASRRRRLAPRDAEADLEHAGRLDVPGLDHALGEQQVAGLEHLELRHHAGVADGGRHRLEDRRRIHEHVRPHVHAAHVEGADFGLEIEHVLHALGAACAASCRGRASSGRRRSGEKRPPGPVVRLIRTSVPLDADALDHLAIKRAVHARLRRSSGRAHGCARSRRRPWRHRSPDAAICSGVTGTAGFLPGVSRRPGHRAGNHDLALHGLSSAASTLFGCSLQRARAAARIRAPAVHVQICATLPPIVRCAKPRQPVLGTNPNCDRAISGARRLSAPVRAGFRAGRVAGKGRR